MEEDRQGISNSELLSLSATAANRATVCGTVMDPGAFIIVMTIIIIPLRVWFRIFGVASLFPHFINACYCRAWPEMTSVYAIDALGGEPQKLGRNK